MTKFARSWEGPMPKGDKNTLKKLIADQHSELINQWNRLNEILLPVKNNPETMAHNPQYLSIVKTVAYQIKMLKTNVDDFINQFGPNELLEEGKQQIYPIAYLKGNLDSYWDTTDLPGKTMREMIEKNDIPALAFLFIKIFQQEHQEKKGWLKKQR